jgi:hypothetical protein
MLAATADYANSTPDAKLNIGGLFGRLPWLGPEYAVPQIYAIFVVAIDPEEYDTEHTFGVVIDSPEGSPVAPIANSTITIPRVPPGDELRMNQVAALAGVRFPVPGTYGVKLVVDGKDFHVLPLPVFQPRATT